MSKIVSDCKLRRQFASQFTQETWRQCNLPILDWHNSTTLQLDVPSHMTILTNQRSLLQHAVGSCVKICFNYSLSALTGRSQSSRIEVYKMISIKLIRSGWISLYICYMMTSVENKHLKCLLVSLIDSFILPYQTLTTNSYLCIQTKNTKIRKYNNTIREKILLLSTFLNLPF